MPSARPAPAGFSGLWIPLLTPFQPHGAIDFAALKRLVAHYRDSGIAGLVVCGSTGEAAALDDDEQLAVLHAVQDTAATLPLVMGVSGYHLGKTVQRVQVLSPQGLQGMLLPAAI